MLISGFDDMVSDIDNSQAVLEAAVHLDGSPTTTAEDSTTAPTPLSSEHVAMIMDWLEPELDELYETSSVVSIDESAGLDQDIQSVLRKEQDLLAGIMEVMDNLDMPCEWLAKPDDSATSHVKHPSPQ
ncbi:hypothetical protein SARC_09663 [Sphaeroforma arctica JP610]|uniref:Uncharacterized protein n=1 Tax=Sphaeroforma arctica JP610 TaxID=667725 RepID=A0A0L0FM76_9EUKA|nr:hypothetical protein SARC_09663 [Sphaeroforma arctica JP610]KNC77889.1 hypothetical protein SARC_09663 [Sphaeroforma arctica JP610]|eukprot:XP_014151791.1 hypothetical protein SARC_09663 [Sphaeroforma arctica JP610]